MILGYELIPTPSVCVEVGCSRKLRSNGHELFSIVPIYEPLALTRRGNDPDITGVRSKHRRSTGETIILTKKLKTISCDFCRAPAQHPDPQTSVAVFGERCNLVIGETLFFCVDPKSKAA